MALRPDGQTVDETYNRAFYYLRTDKHSARYFWDIEGSSLEEVREKVGEKREEIDELEQRFLAREPLDSTVHIGFEDGTEFYSDGTYSGEQGGR